MSAGDSDKADDRAIDLVVTGRVQGVFFRASMQTQAERLGVRGWVRNEDDGSVHAHLEGPAGAVDDLVDWSRTGPPRAEVQEVRVEASQAEGRTRFEA